MIQWLGEISLNVVDYQMKRLLLAPLILALLEPIPLKAETTTILTDEQRETQRQERLQKIIDERSVRILKNEDLGRDCINGIYVYPKNEKTKRMESQMSYSALWRYKNSRENKCQNYSDSQNKSLISRWWNTEDEKESCRYRSKSARNSFSAKQQYEACLKSFREWR